MKLTRSFLTTRLTMLLFAWIFAATAMAGAQTYSVLYNFTGYADGADPVAGLIFGKDGVLYGTGTYGGNFESCDEGGACGVVFSLTPPAQAGGNWTENAFYQFQSGDLYPPVSNVVFDKEGNLYGSAGGDGGLTIGLYQLTESDGVWNQNFIYYSDEYENFGTVATPILDPHNNLYTTVEFNPYRASNGAVVEVSPQSGGTWTSNTVYQFQGGSDGANPIGGVVAYGNNLYGTTGSGGSSSECGTVFELSPHSGGTWKESVLYAFTGTDGCYPYAGVVFDKNGNLYGTTYNGGTGTCSSGCGLVFELSPPAEKGGVWTETVLHQFTNTDGANPAAALAISSTGVLYGTTAFGGNGPCEPTGKGCGTVFWLAPPAKSGGAWIHGYHSFQGTDGDEPLGNVVLDESKSVIYGTTLGGGANGYGVIFQVAK
jgi:uncharacterized repeat protein (TIGR03803 family)